MSGALELAEGTRLVVGEVEWVVKALEPHTGRVWLCCGDERQNGEEEWATTIAKLIKQPDCRSFTASAAGLPSGRGLQPAGLDDLSEQQRRVVSLRFAHLMEVETGFRSGSALRPLPGEPRPAFDPASTSLRHRRLAKVAELQAMDRQEATHLGLHRISERTLERWSARCRKFGMFGCANGSWVRRGGGHPSVSEHVREAIFAVRAETLHRSRMSMKSRERLICQYLKERYGSDVATPSSETLRLVWLEWFGRGGARQRYERSAAKVAYSGEHVVVTRPGQVVALDTTQLAVLVREEVFGEPTAVHLTLALDVYTHSLVAFRLTLVSDTATDVAMVLRDVMMPLPLREDWGDEMEWPYPGIPAAVVAEFAGKRVAALPFFTPETITTDHGAVYKNHHLVEVQRVLGANILPARVLRPTDKAACERAFAVIQSLLLEILPGYRGVDVADRGADPQGDAVLTITELEHVIATWIVRIWQNRELGEHAPAWDPAGRHSPNTLFAAAMAQGGFAMQIPSAELFYQLLPAHRLKIHGGRGVKVKGLWYDGSALDPYRDGPSQRGGVFKGSWVIRRDPRDRRSVFFQDPDTGDWHTLRWTGLPSESEMPVFGDARVAELLHAAKARGLTPQSDQQLLPLLLELIGGHVPVDAWPTQIPKSRRAEHSREVLQGQAAQADRPIASAGQDGATVTAIHAEPRPSRAAQAASALDGERRQRREQVMAGRIMTPPPRLGEVLRRSGPFLRPSGDDHRPPVEEKYGDGQEAR